MTGSSLWYTPGTVLPPKIVRQSRRTVKLTWNPTVSSLIMYSWKMSALGIRHTNWLTQLLSTQPVRHCPPTLTWMNALAWRHLEPSTVTFNPFCVALKMAWSLKEMAFRMLDRFLALSKLAIRMYWSMSAWDWVDRGMVLCSQHLK